ncbi:hypothetical protein Hneap_1143 [Halothiobacillus neapolitanus c2]|uniref:Uncharacterized protein n=1 Tax=Halothiobacillus neapolitanus (strain ATCC 23641 / DSM 15147 / CIP 104769 / NCIMB 8539 / c2) TaxID=555778 RepID=D0KZV6_HALNC|nr:hypothetical protein Hneap_1143 [Halothiobacillus neapolitanus c2]TDN66287.1 hypothetical protein C8D83_101618 [Halothiobacillus neapolitanus]
MIPTASKHGCHIFLLEHRSLYCRQTNKAKMIMIFKFRLYLVSMHIIELCTV